MNPRLFDLEQKAREKMYARDFPSAEILLVQLLSLQEFLFGSRNRLVLRTLRSLLEVYTAEKRLVEANRIETRIMACEYLPQQPETEAMIYGNL